MILRLYIHTTGKVTGITKGSTNEVNYLGAMRKEMEEQIDGLVEKIMADFKRKPAPERSLVAIAGPPGCGKSTLVEPLCQKLQSILSGDETTGSEKVISVSLDGWHMSRAELDQMEDPVEAHWRRGAAFTFDLEKYHTFLERLRDTSTLDPPLFFTFDHALKDPIPSSELIDSSHRLIIIEGLYTMLDRPGWKDCAMMMDRRVWIDVDEDVARKRVIRRNLAAGIVEDEEGCIARVDAVDMLNGVEVRSNRVEPTDIIRSIDE